MKTKNIEKKMEKDPWYLTVGKTPIERMEKLLSKLDSIGRSREQGSMVSKADRDLSYKYIGQIKSIFKNLSKPLKWKPFLMSDLILLTDSPFKVKKKCVNETGL